MKLGILIVEEECEDRDILENFLTMMGYRTTILTDGSAVMEELEKGETDLLILSVDLKDRPGILLLKEIKENLAYEDLPVILLAEGNDDKLSIIGLSSGASEIIRKPFEVAELTLKIQNSLELSNARKALLSLNTKLEKEKRLLTRYFSEDLVEKILLEEVSPDLGGNKVKVTTMFFDLRNSTSIAESMDPDAFAGMLSQLFSKIMDCIFAHRGSVNKLLGDGVMATFGAPIPTNEDALHAVPCGVEILEILKEMKGEHEKKGLPVLQAGIGIATGEVFAGNVGSSRRMEYTVLGNSVNLAARLEKLTKKVGIPLLLDEATFHCVKQQLKCNHIITVQVRGQSHACRVYSHEKN